MYETGNELTWGNKESTSVISYSDYLENALLDHVLGNTPLSQPTNIYIALCKSTIDKDDTGTTLPNEVSGGAYARQKCNTWDAASAGVVKNSQVELFPKATAPWGTLTDFALVDALTDGNVLAYGKLDVTKKIGTGDRLRIGIGDLEVEQD
jgi:hypothetical protein